MDRILPAIFAGIVVLAAGFALFYFFIEHYAKKRMEVENSIDGKLKKLDEILPVIDGLMKMGVELKNGFTPEYVGAEDDIKLAKEIENAASKSNFAAEPDDMPVEELRDGNPNDLWENLFEKL